MSTTGTKIDSLTATLPEGVRGEVESRLVEDAEALVQAYRSQGAERVAAAKDGLTALEQGDVLTMDEFRAQTKALVAELRAKAT